MNDVKEIRRQLWYSLDMAYVKFLLFVVAICAPASLLIGWLGTLDYYSDIPRWPIIWFITLLVNGPFLVFCIIRTFNIFRHLESYHFCKTKLSNPKGGSLRDTIKFTLLLEDADGGKFIADSHSIFHTHTSMFGLGFEDYVNQTVTAGYNEETGQVVIIG